MIVGSIRGRLLLLSAALTGVATLAAWVWLSAVLGDFVTRRLEAELTATARAVVAASEWADEGRLVVDPPPADPRFEAPLSGWYWQVSTAAEIAAAEIAAEPPAGARALARSPSLVTAELDPARAVGPDGAPLMLRRRDFTAPGDGRPLVVLTALPEAERLAELAAIRRPLGIGLAGLALALILAQLVAVTAGLRDLTRFTRAIARLEATGGGGPAPAPRARELAPLAAALGRLIATNAETVARARAHAGNLAHALKTPLAALGARADAEDSALIERMDRTLRWHLKRARAAGAASGPYAATSLAPVFEDIELVLRGEADRRGIALVADAAGAPDFRGDAEDLVEMVGALAENAVKWARARVVVAARGEPGGRLVVVVADDGPGVPAPERERITARGARLDEAAPGYGLGLAIVGELSALYGGSLILAEAPGGGLEARLVLPAASPS